MTAKQLFEGVLIEVKKEDSPEFHVREFNHYANETIAEYVDDLNLTFQVEKNHKVLDVIKTLKRFNIFNTFTPTAKGQFSFTLPTDYRHLSNLIVRLGVVREIIDKCYEVGDEIEFPATQLSPELEASTIQDPFQRPRYFRPRYSITGNICEVFLGEDVSLPGGGGALELRSVRADYIKNPDEVVLTYTQAHVEENDTSQVLEFDDITARHIRKRLIQRIFERDSNPRLQTHLPVTSVKPTPDLISLNQQR